MTIPKPDSIRETHRQSLITSALYSRPSRHPDYEAEAKVLGELAHALATSDTEMLDTLAREAARLCRADSAGISVLESPPDRPASFRWAALAGRAVPLLNTHRPFDDSLCGVTLALGKPELFGTPQRFFPSIEMLSPPVVEALLVPIPVRDDAWGAIWVMSQRPEVRFDAEDLRLLTSLADFTGATMQVARMKALAESRAIQAETAQSALREAETRKDEFIATLSHELRSPIAPIDSAIKCLGRLELQSQQAEQALDIAERQLHRLQRLVDDLFDASRIRQGKVTVRPENSLLADILNDAIAAVRPQMEARRHTLTVTAPSEAVLVYVDAGRITQVLANVLSNAAKYSPDGSRIDLTAAVDVPTEPAGPTTEATLLMTVADEGYGISAPALPHVFDMFTQRGSHSPSTEAGLGIGLALVKYLVEAHGGTVAVQSDESSSGTTVTIRLPLSRGPELSGTQPHATAPCAPCRVLVVDDDKDTVESLALLLGLDGHIVRTATSAPEALSALDDFTPDVAFIDVNMPDMDGFSLAAELRTRPALKHLKLVAFTGDTSESDRVAALSAGFDRHMAKPVDMQALTSILASVGETPR
ncbi:hybrid sensor histidine kinase/response regulator [Paraburkholderia sp. RL17-337-BIB-A]|uniref:hybrid sensor histidine kinase/response regulator n=1 Tax=Paraburkholderia sp. RL17-337-BIB-A TaxID=3031636 RepID=UPI0038BBFABC